MPAIYVSALTSGIERSQSSEDQKTGERFEVDQGTVPLRQLQIRPHPRLTRRIELNQLAFGSRVQLQDRQAATALQFGGCSLVAPI